MMCTHHSVLPMKNSHRSADSLPCACTTVRKASRSLFRFYEAGLAESDLSVTQFALLRALERNGATPLSRLAEELVAERTSLYRMLKPLETAGLVATRDAETGRARIAELTARGRRQLSRAAGLWSATQQKAVERIGAARWAELSQLLLEIPELLTAEDGR